MFIIFLTVVITGISGYLGLRNIVAEVSHSSEPELKLTLVKEVVSDISEAENNIKSYTLTRDVKYLSPFYNSILIADKNFTDLKELTKDNAAQLEAIEEMEELVDEKYSVLNEMLTLYPDENIKNELAKISVKIANETQQLNAEQQKHDHIQTPADAQPKKKTFLQRLFAKPEKSLAVDSSVIEKHQKAELQSHKQLRENINKEIEQVNKQHIEQRNIIKQKELALVERSGNLTLRIGELFNDIENIEKGIIAKKIAQATERAKQTNRLVALFCIMAGLSLIIVCFVSLNYVHKKRKYEKFLEDKKNHAELLAHSKEIFLANMSHEIRTPMNAISGFTNQILKTELTAEQREQLKIVQKSNEHLIRIVNDILDYSKMEAGKFNFEHSSFNPDKVLKEVIDLTRPLLKNDKVKISYNVTGQMPEFVVGDAVRLKQIVLNLLSNSIKFTEQGEVSISAGFTNTTDGKLLLNLKVNDTGIGIAKDKIKEIFGEFQQADATIYYKYGGTGLGLPITKKLVELQNGNINIESIEGKGTTTSIQIPYTESKAGTVFFKENGKPVTVDERFLKTLKVLIADDDEYNRKLLNVILRKWNADVKEARNGKEVLEELMKNPYDILLLDIRMPEMNGIEAAQKIRKLKDLAKAETPIIALTAVTTEEKKRSCIEAGINDFLSKPFKEEDLFKKIVNLTDLENSEYIHKDINQPNSRAEMKNEKNNLFSLEELRQLSNGDEKFVEEMINIFIKTTTEGMNAIEKALDKKEYHTIAEYTHKLSPPCRHMGADELYTKFKTIEDEVRKHETPKGLDSLIAEARAQTDKVINGLKKEMNDKQIS